jgi:hypothetical protein
VKLFHAKDANGYFAPIMNTATLTTVLSLLDFSDNLLLLLILRTITLKLLQTLFQAFLLAVSLFINKLFEANSALFAVLHFIQEMPIDDATSVTVAFCLGFVVCPEEKVDQRVDCLLKRKLIPSGVIGQHDIQDTRPHKNGVLFKGTLNIKIMELLLVLPSQLVVLFDDLVDMVFYVQPQTQLRAYHSPIFLSYDEIEAAAWVLGFV